MEHKKTQAPAEANDNQYFITTFYAFLPVLERQAGKTLEQVKTEIEEIAKKLDLLGLLILGNEGFNSTLAAPNLENLNAWKNWIKSYFQCDNMLFKNSYSPKAPFRLFKVKIREEIVTLGTPELQPESAQNHHLSPEQWNETLQNEDVLLIDTRNWYETKIGTFKGAINPGIDQFTEFPQWLEQQNYSKDKKMLIFCTGGIRCEKGILELQRQGYDNVYQLEGGILRYIEEFPNNQFDGECFVFDRRVAVTQELEPTTRYLLCPHCGQPSEIKITCKRCDSEVLICDQCVEKAGAKDTCSKHCNHQLQLHPGRKGPKQK
ncbi:MAG: hypothetical protein KBE16_08710 [Alphaproteobacteria bacterium]|nr:hypothetical protein [Alphaproteobacteria bacterium]